MDETTRLAGRAYDDPFPWSFLTDLIEAGPRLGGSPGERRAAELVAEAFETAGAAPETLPFEMPRWKRGDATVAVRLERDGRLVERSFDAIALPYSPPGDVHGSLTDVGHGTPTETDEQNVAGTVALADTASPADGRYVHRMEKYGHAVEAGASGFVFAHHEPGQLAPTGTLRFGREAAVPAVGVSHETGEWLREYADTDAEVRLRVDATTEPGTSRNVLGQLGPADDERADGILVVGHLDAHDIAEGALDNGCGITTVATAARYLADLSLAAPVWVAGVGCEETGLLGAEALADHLTLDRIRAVVNVDGAGRHRNLRALVHGSDSLASLAEQVVEAAGQPLAVSETPHPYSDHWPFLRAGIPAIQLHSQPASGHERGRGWGHTAADTRDKVDQRTLRDHAVLTALLVRELTQTDVPRRDPATLRAELEAEDAEPGMRAAGVWPDDWG
ncbi:M28 family peptidase [Halosegnis sp.]|uniref:M28 family peptidase n=1 Tax=Halosegnis sp. TaxID=2864959 RepID=UPI0035D51C71